MTLKNPLLWFTFLLYLVVAGIALANHEMWADELHSWNIAKGSGSLPELFNNSRYEGHPPLWYIILWCISKFTHNLAAVQGVHFFIAAAPVFFILFFSRIPLVTRILIPFGYYFLFEYAVLSRNYAAAILLATLICVIMRRNFRYKTAWYYLLLLLLTNTHLLGALLAGSLHVYYLLLQREQHRNTVIITAHALLGLLVALPALYFIMPPEGSVLAARPHNMDALFTRAKTFMQAPLRSMLPLPAWWHYNWWNSQFLVETREGPVFIRVLSLVVAIGLPVLAGFVLGKDKKSLAMFFANFIFSAAIALTVLTLTAARYTGFIHIGFVLALWLYCEEYALVGWRKIGVNILLIVHVAAGLFAVAKDAKYPFSNSYRVKELVKKVPEGRRLVCDYWAVNAYVPYIDKPVFCIDLQRKASFILFDKDVREKLQAGSRYTNGLHYLQQQTSFAELYLLSTHPPEALARLDSNLHKRYRVSLIDKREGAIEKFSNLYLYRIQVN